MGRNDKACAHALAILSKNLKNNIYKYVQNIFYRANYEK